MGSWLDKLEGAKTYLVAMVVAAAAAGNGLGLWMLPDWANNDTLLYMWSVVMMFMRLITGGPAVVSLVGKKG